MEGDVLRLVEMAETFTNPFTLSIDIGKNLFVNGVDIFKNILSAVQAFENDNYYSFGLYIGEALVEVAFSTQ